MTPFQVVYGHLSPTISIYQVGSSPVNEIDQQLISRDETLKLLKNNLQAAINHMQQIASSKRREIEFHERDLVFLKHQPYRQ